MASLAGGITLFATAFLIYGLLLPAIGLPPPVSECLNTDNALVPNVFQNLLWGTLITYIIAQWAGIKTFSTGMKTGAGLGVVLGLLIALMFYGAVTVFDEKIFAIGPLSFQIRFGLAGGVIVWVLGRK